MFLKKKLVKFNHYDKFESLSSFAIGLIDLFIPIFLYEKGYPFSFLFEFLFLTSAFSLFLYFFISYLGNYMKYQWIIILSVLSFVLSYFFLYKIELGNSYIFIFIFFYSFYKVSYEMGKNYYAIESLPLTHMGNFIAKITISSIIATLFASFIGSSFLTYYPTYILLIFSSFLFLLSVFFLVQTNYDKKIEKASFLEVFKGKKLKNSIVFFFHECFTVEKMIFPLYLYFYIEKNIELIGLYNFVTSIFSFAFIYFIAKKMDKNKKDYLFLSAFFLACVFLLKVEVESICFLLLLGMVEGIFSSMYEVGMEHDFYYTASHYKKAEYLLYNEFIRLVARCFFFFLLFFLPDIRFMIFILAIGVLFTSFVSFDDGKGGYKED